MSKSKTSRMVNTKPINIPKLIAFCLFLGLLTMVYLNQRISRKLDQVKLENLYIKDSLKLKTSIVNKEDSTYGIWINDHALRARLNAELQGIK